MRYNPFNWATTNDYTGGQPLPSNAFSIENAYELLDQHGEWYFNRTTNVLYYYPKSGENINTATVYVPKIDTIIDFEGTSTTNKVKNIEFNWITFSYTGWARALSVGVSASQADLYSSNYGNGSHTDNATIVPGAIIANLADNIGINRGSVSHTGGAGILFNNGVSNSKITANTITDISAAGIIISTWKHNFIDEANEEVPQNDLIFNNTITYAGTEYHSGAAVSAYYTDSLVIDHNFIQHLPWAGITTNWNGWQSSEKDSVTNRNLVITSNHVEDYAEVLRDVAGIYTVGHCPNMEIAFNYTLHCIRDYAGIYNDEGSAFIYIHDNVMEDPSTCNFYWWSSRTHDIYAVNNYSNNTNTVNNGVRTYSDNMITYSGYSRTAAAQTIVNNAGTTGNAYNALKSYTTGDVAYNKNARFIYNGSDDFGTRGHLAQFAVDGNNSFYGLLIQETVQWCRGYGSS